MCVFCAGTLSIDARTWTECSTSMQATGQCSSSGSWTGKRTPGTTSPSSPRSSVSAAGWQADFSVHPLPLILSAKLDFWSWYQLLSAVCEVRKRGFCRVLEQAVPVHPVLADSWCLFPTPWVPLEYNKFSKHGLNSTPERTGALIWNRQALNPVITSTF